MHFTNYIRSMDVDLCIAKGEEKVSATPTALRQTPKTTLRRLEEHGVRVERVERLGRPRKLSEGEVKRLLAIRTSDLSFYKVAGITGIAKSTVFDYWKRYRDTELAPAELEEVQRQEAERVLREVLDLNLDEDINALVLKGLQSDLEGMRAVLQELKERLSQ